MLTHSSRCVLVSALLLLTYTEQVFGVANIDISQPIVRTSPAKGATDNGDSFGYSVVLHQIQEPTDFESAIQYTRIIVGAPHGTFPGGLNLTLSVNSSAENTTGLVFQCPVSSGECGALGRGSDSLDAASGVRLFDDHPDKTELDEAAETSVDEQKSGQLMGQVLLSSGDYFMACAPRWTPISLGPINSFDNRKNIGRCFLSGKDLSQFVEVRPCRGDNDRESFNVLTDNRCQAGFGATFFQRDGGEGQTGILMSGPGTQAGRGRLYQYNNASFLLTSNTLEMANEQSPTFSTLEFRHSLYDGWSVTTGNLDGTAGDESLISSMPRFDGQLLSGRVNVRSGVTDAILSTVSGTQNGEYFGHVVETADLNNDGFDEILVGAPLYSTSTKQELGRVYVFENNGGVLNKTAIVLTGTRARGRFGHSIVNMGDVNGDSIQDIAIGAPYERDPTNPNAVGAVYIHYGNENSVIDTFPSQTLAASSVMATSGLSSLKSFGFSLGSDVDVDNNGYSDLVVGAYESQTAVLFRTRSVARINFNLTTDKEFVQLISDSFFTVTLCATYNGRGLDGRPLNMSYELTEDAQIFRGSPQRRISNPVYRGELTFPSTDVMACNSITIELIPILQLPNGLGLREPVTVRVRFEEVPLPPVTNTDQLTDLRDFPLLRENGESTISITPMLGCSSGMSGEVCTPDLSVSVTSIEYRGGSSSQFDAIVAGGVASVRFSLIVQNLASQPAINSFLSFTLPADFLTGVQVVPSSPGQPSSAMSCNTPEQPTSYECLLPTFINNGNDVIVVLDWTVAASDIVGTEPDVMATFNVSIPASPDMEIVTDNNVVTVTLPVTAITDPAVTITFEGPPSYSTDGLVNNPPQSLTDLGNTADIILTITNIAPSVLPRARLELSVPINATESSFFYLYVGQLQTSGSDSGVVCGREGVNPDGLSSTSRSRRKRSLVKRQSEPENQAVTESCSFDNPSSSCQTFSCNITNLNQEFSLLILAVLDRRFYQNQMNSFTFTAFARITSLDGFDQFDDNPNNNIASSSYFVSPPEAEPPNLYLEIWLPIIGALLALLLIVLMFVCCIYCGFFRKKRLEQAKKEAGGEFEVRQVPPEEPAVITGEDKEKGHDDFNDIGDTNDLGNGDDAPEKDPEETSL